MSNIVSQGLVAKFFGGFVLAFHEIPAERLVEFVESLAPAKPVPLTEIVERAKKGRSTSGVFAITVDDGVGDNVRTLTSVFLSRGWPGTFYLPTQYLDTANGMMFQWWRCLKPLLPRTRLELTSGVIDLSRPGATHELSRRMESLWYTQRLESYCQTITELAAIVSRQLGGEAIQPPPPITWKEVEGISKNDLIRFESHGVSHAAMSALTDEELEFEMRHSRDVVTEHTGHPCRHLAYPFGGYQSIGPRAVAAARRFYDSATTMSLGTVDSANPWLMPRIPLYPQNPTWLARVKVILKCGKTAFFQPASSRVNLNEC